jgi:CheY-like chemotaxis protein
MVEQHGGVIQVDSVEGSGSAFTVRLPLVPQGKEVQHDAPPDFTMHAATIAAMADEIRVEAAPHRDGTEREDAPSVLVVEDNPDVRAYLGRHLGRHYCVIEAADGDQALKAMRERPPDLVVSDVAMPELDGYALCRAIRADPELEFVPIVLLSAAAASENRVTGFESGADGYLSARGALSCWQGRPALASRRRLRERITRAAAAAVVYGTELPGDAPAGPAVPRTERVRRDAGRSGARRRRTPRPRMPPWCGGCTGDRVTHGR